MISKAKVLGLPGNNFEKAMADFERVIDEALSKWDGSLIIVPYPECLESVAESAAMEIGKRYKRGGWSVGFVNRAWGVGEGHSHLEII